MRLSRRHQDLQSCSLNSPINSLSSASTISTQRVQKLANRHPSRKEPRAKIACASYDGVNETMPVSDNPKLVQRVEGWRQFGGCARTDTARQSGYRDPLWAPALRRGRVQNILHREWSDELYFAIECRWLHHVHLHSLNAGLEKRARQPRGRCLDRPLFAELFACRAR
jgi:hypothetical protein